MSLIPRSRLTCDSTRSPSTPVITSIRPERHADPRGLVEQERHRQHGAVMPNTSEPPSPSHDFFGLIAGAIRCLPNSTPAT